MLPPWRGRARRLCSLFDPFCLFDPFSIRSIHSEAIAANYPGRWWAQTDSSVSRCSSEMMVTAPDGA
jgi:hypothetical protein